MRIHAPHSPNLHACIDLPPFIYLLKRFFIRSVHLSESGTKTSLHQSESPGKSMHRTFVFDWLCYK